VGDELLALDDRRLCTPEDWERELNRCQPGTVRMLLWVRDGVVRRSPLRPEPPAPLRWVLEPDPAADDVTTRDRRSAWLRLTPP